MSDAESETRSSRFWLYAPFGLLVLVAIGWSVAWTVVRNRVEEGLDRFLAVEAQAGRQWTCRDRSIGGYPFRIEARCASLDLKGGPVTASLGRVHSVAQVYQPGHVITEIDGPLRLTDGIVTVEGTWRLLETSVRGSMSGFQRGSVVADDAAIKVTGLAPEPVRLTSRHVEAHLRPNPSSERAYDAAISAKEAALPLLDAWLGGAEPANLQIDVTAREAAGFRGRPVVEEIERWRQANGQVDVLLLSLNKGPRRLELKGALRLDELHRPAGEFGLAAAGLDTLVANLTGNRVGGNLLGAIFGGTRPAPQPGASPQAPGLTPLPPLRLENGRVLFGPFPIPNLRLQPLY